MPKVFINMSFLQNEGSLSESDTNRSISVTACGSAACSGFISVCAALIWSLALFVSTFIKPLTSILKVTDDAFSHLV